MSESAQTPWTVAYMTNTMDCGLHDRPLSLTVLEAGKSQIKVPTNLVPGESRLPGFQRVTFPLCPQGEETERVPSVSSSSYKATNTTMRTPPS